MIRAHPALAAEVARFSIETFEPAYLGVLRAGAFPARVEAALAELRACVACPRRCGNDRLAGELRACHTGRHARVATSYPHFGEEPCLTGTHGSGTIFFSLCNLRCVFCQNWELSQERQGEELDASQLAGRMLELQAKGCHNVNLVTPEHVAPQVVEALHLAAERGLAIPVVYNTSAYDAVSSLRLLDGLVDVYLPDFKFWEPETAARLARARDYPEHARAAIAEMHRQVGPLRFGADGLARRGVLVRHLVMPGLVGEAAAIFRFLASLSRDTWVHVMAQFYPAYRVGRAGRDGAPEYPELDRAASAAELAEAIAAARDAGLWRIEHP